MGTLFVLFSPCFRENVVVTCKIGSFLCSLDNLLQKKVIVFFPFFFFFFEIKFQNGAHGHIFYVGYPNKVDLLHLLR